MKLFTSVFMLLLMMLCMVSCNNESEKRSTDKVEVVFKKEGTLQLKKKETDSLIISLDIEVADSEYEVQTGLMYRTQLANNQGMLFIFPDEDYRSFYMKNTKIPLDIIYIDALYTIVSFQKNAKPLDESSLPSGVPAKYVLEVYAGQADEWQLDLGDKIDFQILE